MCKLLAVLWLALIALAAPAAAQTFPERGREPVVDQADLLRPEQELDLKSKSEALYAQTGRQFVVATVKSLEGRTIEDYGYRLGRHWKIGDEKKDDGVILLVAPNEKKVRIETGYGARVFLTDAVSGVIIRESILPRFKANDMGGGITAGADQIIKMMSLSPQEAQRQAGAAEQREQARDKSGSGLIPVIFWLMIAVFVLLSMFRRSGGRRYQRRKARAGGVDPWIVLWGLSELSQASRRGGGWGGGGGGFGGFDGGGGGGFGGFSGGGGSFGGGGASGGW
jgi:uncharacterized protein